MNEPFRTDSNDPAAYDYQNSDPMSHAEAAQLNAVELYVLKELPPDQELRFEEHYFDCPECSHAVALVQSIADNPAVPARQVWWRRLAFPALTPLTAGLLTLCLYQNVQVIPTLHQELAAYNTPQANTVILAHPVEMGTSDGETIKTPSVTIEFNLPSDGARSAFYRVDIIGEGKGLISQIIPAPDGPHASLHVTKQLLGHGSYNVMVFGLATQETKDGPQIGQYHFSIR